MMHPMQNIRVDFDGTIRFQENKIVTYLLEVASKNGCDMNKLAAMDFPDEDRMQFAQLIGYSLSGYAELSYANEDSISKMDKKLNKLLKKLGLTMSAFRDQLMFIKMATRG